MQCSLFGDDGPEFDGPDLEPEDHARLGGLLARVYQLMADGAWRTLREIAEAAGCSEASASARVRDLRKPRFGGHLVEKKRDAVCRGLYRYRLVERR